MVERWKPIIGYEDNYEISDFGRVKSLVFKNGTVTKRKERILTPTDNGNGYLIISLIKGGKRKNHYIHRLVADAFVARPTGKNVVNHKDFNKKNNNYKNLEWCTQKENIDYSICNMKKPKKATKSKTGEKYIYIRNGRYRLSIKGKTDKTFLTLEEAIRYRNEVLHGISITK